MRRNVWLGLVAAAAMLGASAAQAQQTLKVAAWIGERSTAVSQVMQPWMEAVEADSNGQVEMKGYWGGSLGRSPTSQYDLLKNGVADVSFIQPFYTPGQFPELDVFELPFLARTGVEAGIAAWRLHERGMVSGLEDVHVIGFYAGSPNILFAREPLTTLEDLRNKRVRSVGALNAQWLTAIGAAPQTLSAVEANEMLNRGQLTAVVQGWTGMQTFKSFPLVTHTMEVPVGTILFSMMMNKKTWEGLPEDVKQAAMAHGGEKLACMGGGAYDDASESIRTRVLGEGNLQLVDVSDADMETYAAQAKEVHEAWIAKDPRNAEVYEAVQEILADIRANDPCA